MIGPPSRPKCGRNMAVNIRPLPDWARTAAHRPLPPPVFDGEPTPADYRLAVALFLRLDPDSKRWYGGEATLARWQAAADAQAKSS